jgi:hypothetical protein
MTNKKSRVSIADLIREDGQNKQVVIRSRSKSSGLPDEYGLMPLGPQIISLLFGHHLVMASLEKPPLVGDRSIASSLPSDIRQPTGCRISGA